MSAIEGRAKVVQAGKKLMTDWQDNGRTCAMTTCRFEQEVHRAFGGKHSVGHSRDRADGTPSSGAPGL